MTPIIALLKGINVGNNNRIKMADLRQLVSKLGYDSPKTVLASGNVIFPVSDTSPDIDTISTNISNAIQAQYNYHIEVIVRTGTAWQTLINNNPFATRDDIAGNKLVAFCLQTTPPADAVATLNDTYPEEVVLSGDTLYVHYLNGQAKTKLTTHTVENTLNTICTGRNWNTVEKIQNVVMSMTN